MGNQLALHRSSVGIEDDINLDIPSNISISRRLGDGRFLKTYEAVGEEGTLVCRVFIKPKASEFQESFEPSISKSNSVSELSISNKVSISAADDIINQSFNESLNNSFDVTGSGVDLTSYISELNSLEMRLTDLNSNRLIVPNASPYRMYFQTDRAGYLFREAFAHSLEDRLLTRPHITLMEKRWLAFQLLKALEGLHKLNIYHGDIKMQNCMVTTWGWLVLVDFAPYKPVMLPAEQPSIFSYFFDTSFAGRRTCTVAPERFYNKEKDGEENVGIGFNELNEKMDIFSAGCVIAELFMEAPLFDLSSLLGYKASKGSALGLEALERNLESSISDSILRKMIMDMLVLNPSKRNTAKEIIDKWSGQAWPKYFNNFLHPFMSEQMYCSNEERIVNMNEKFDNILLALGYETISDNSDYSKETSKNNSKSSKKVVDYSNMREKEIQSEIQSEGEISKLMKENQELGIAAELFQRGLETRKPRLKRRTREDVKVHSSSIVSKLATAAEVQRRRLKGGVEKAFISEAPTTDFSYKSQFSTISDLAGVSGENDDDSISQSNKEKSSRNISFKLPINVDVSKRTPKFIVGSRTQDGLSIFVMLICSCIRNIGNIDSKKLSLDVLLRYAQYSSNNHRIGRLVPYVIAMFSDSSEFARAHAIYKLADLMEMIEHVSSSDEKVFIDYIMPALVNLGRDESVAVRVALATCISRLATSGKHILEMSASHKKSWVAFEAHLANIQSSFMGLVTTLLSDTHSDVIRSLLRYITDLCIFFGREASVDHLIPLTLQLLSSSVWLVRSAFFASLVGLGAFLGRASLEAFIYSAIHQALTDSEENVIESAIMSFAGLAELGLFRKQVLLDGAKVIAPLLCHPNIWIRYASIRSIAVVSNQLIPIDLHSQLLPILEPFIKKEINIVTESSIVSSIKDPIPRSIFETALSIIVGEKDNVEHSVLITKVKNVFHKRLGDSEYVNLDEEGKDINQDEEDKKVSQIIKYLFSLGNSINQRHYINDDKMKKRQGVLDISEYKNLSKIVPYHYVLVQTPSPEKCSFILRTHWPINSQENLNNKSDAQIFSENDEAISETVNIFDFPNSSIIAKKQLETFNFWMKLNENASKDIFNIKPNLGLLYHERLIKKEEDLESLSRFDVVILRGDENKSNDNSNDPFWRYPEKLISNGVKGWIPKGLLAANYVEHQNAVNELAVSEDNLFFASASDDGTVKIWDARRTEKNLTNKSHFTYSGQSGKIKTLSMCENSHSIISGSSDGSLFVWRIECQTVLMRKNISNGPSTIFADTSSVYSNNKFVDKPIVSVKFWNSNSQSVVCAASADGKVRGWDLRSNSNSFSFDLPSKFGSITCMLVDPVNRGSWILLGTSWGYLILWDVRFSMISRYWRHPNKAPITSVSMYNGSSLSSDEESIPELIGPQVLVSCGENNEFSSWYLTKEKCSHVYRTVQSSTAKIKPNVFRSNTTVDYTEQMFSNIRKSKPKISTNVILQGSEGTIFTAGTDRMIRVWNTSSFSKSYILGLNTRFVHPPPVYSVRTISKEKHQYLFEEIYDNGSEKDNSKSTNTKDFVSHTDVINDLKLVNWTAPALVSAGREGIIKIWV